MGKLIERASGILEDKFRIKPEKSRLYLHEDIASFLRQTESPNAQSLFLPKTLSAHAPSNRLDLAIHEYLGHGLYCEYTKYGKRIVEEEKRFHAMRPEEIEQARQVHNCFAPLFEGHALWTEDFLLRALLQGQLLERRVEELKTLKFSSVGVPEFKTQRDLYDGVKGFEKAKGIYETWYSFGLPRKFDGATLTEIAKEKLKERFKNLVFLVHFGSTNEERDIDLCAVLEDGTSLDRYVHSRTIDLTQFNYSKFLERMRLFDLPITQPLMTGRLVLGDKNQFERLKQELMQQKPTDEAIRFLQHKSQWCFNYAINELGNNSQYSFGLEVVLSNLAYALSFCEVAKAYQSGKTVLTLSELTNPLLKEVREYMKADVIKREKVQDYVAKVKASLSP